jgi:5'-deoxynucleotidase YfbR-like HD superfamily hydrolase
VPPHLALQGLMHDAPEAYLGDVIRPLKYELPNYLEIERQLWRVIAYRFGLPEELSTEVKHADNVALMTERRDLIIESPWQWEIPECPDDTTIVPVELIKARQMFLERFSFLQAAVRKEVEG